MKLYLYLKHFPSCGAPLVGGTAKAVHGLASGLAACGANVTILCEGAETEDYQREDGLRVRCFQNRVRRPSFRLAPGLKRFIRSEQEPDLVILNGQFHPSLYALATLLRKSSTPYVVAPHMPYHPEIFKSKMVAKWCYWHLLERHLLAKASAIQLLDGYHAAFLAKRKVGTNTMVVPNGYCDRDAATHLHVSAMRRSPIRLFYLGRMDAYSKGLDLLLMAFAELTGHVDATLTLQGPDQGSRKALEKMAAQLSITDRVTFLDSDYVSPSAVIFSQYDIFCLPSRNEGFSLAAIEAMLAGRALLVSRIAGVAHYVEASDCGIVVSPTRASVLRGLESLVVRQTEWPEMGSRGRRYAIDHLSWKNIAGAALEQYEQLLDRNRPAAPPVSGRAYG